METTMWGLGFRAPSYLNNLNSRLLGYVIIGYVEPSCNYLGNWEPSGELWSKLLKRGCMGDFIGSRV